MKPVNCPITIEPLKLKGPCTNIAVIPFSLNSYIKAVGLHFNNITTALFHTRCVGVQRQNNEQLLSKYLWTGL